MAKWRQAPFAAEIDSDTPFLGRQLRALQGKNFGSGNFFQVARPGLPRNQCDFLHRGFSSLPFFEFLYLTLNLLSAF